MGEGTTNIVTRRGKFDAAHRVLHERFKCFNLHGHEYHYELAFAWTEALDLGYAIDFKEIKRVVCEWIDVRMDHGFIANPKDEEFLGICKKMGLKTYEMHLLDANGFCNPSAENIAKEIYFASLVLLDVTNLKISSVKLWETVNCFVECHSLPTADLQRFYGSDLYTDLFQWRKDSGIVEYDERKVVACESQ